MSRTVKWLVGILTAITVASLVTVTYVIAGRGGPDTDDEAEGVQAQTHTSIKDGRTVLSLGPRTRAREGIRVSSVSEVRRRVEQHGTGVVLAVSELATARNTYVATHAKLERDRVELGVSRSQYERVKTLYAENQNMSQQAMQDAEATYHNTAAQLEADSVDARLQLDGVRQQWGPVVARWLATNTTTLESVLEQRELLVQVVFPPGDLVQPPPTVSLIAPGHQLVQGRLVSPLPQVNPQIQGVTYLYLVTNRQALAIGMNVAALLPAGEPVPGVVVPDSAVVWWEGEAWVYEATSPNSFARRELPTDNPTPGGYFVPSTAVNPGSALVVAGAQALLSEEFRAQIQEED